MHDGSAESTGPEETIKGPIWHFASPRNRLTHTCLRN